MTGDPLVDRLLESTRQPPQAAVTADLVDRLLSMPTPDTRTGAPANVRAAVGSAQTPNDRLATMRRFYPDAQPQGSDNFIFNDPRSGRPTLYNPPGMDMGDVASVIPEAGEYLGGIVGGALAAPVAIGGIPATGGASVLAVPAGVGLGAAAGREIATLGANAFGGTVDTRTPGTRVADAATTAGINAVAGPIVDAAVVGARRVLGPVRRLVGGQGLATPQDFAEAGVRASAGDVTGNRLTQTLQVASGNTIGGARRYGAFMEGQGDDLGRAVQQTAESIGVPTTPGNAGAAIREGAGEAVERFGARQNALYDRAFALIPQGARAELPAVMRLRQELIETIQQAPESASARLGPAVERIDRLLRDSGVPIGEAAVAGRPRGLSLDAVRSERTSLGQLLRDNPAATAAAAPPESRQALNRFYGALTEDMQAHVRNAGGDEAQRALSVADRYTRFNRTQNMPALERVQKQGTDQQVYDMLFPQSGRVDPQSLNRVLRNLQPDERSAVAATVLDRMGTPNAGAQAGEDFSAATFLTRWNELNKAGPAARRVLFGDDGTELGRGLDRLTRVAASMRDTARYTNWSGTARIGGAIAAGGLIGNEAMQGDVGGVAGAVGLTLVAPAAAARLMTNPRFVNWLASAAPTIARNEASPGLVASLSRIGAVNPEIRDAVEEYRAAITSRPRQQ